MKSTMFDALRLALADAAKYNKSVQEQPAAILWTDAEGQWGSVVARLRAFGVPILRLGEYDSAKLQGPAIWLKCALAGKLPEVELGDKPPVLYLPGVSRANLRAIETCPRYLQPIAELQYRGVFWTQVNAKDWTVNAFLTAKKGGLGLDVAQDKPTQEGMIRALDVLLDTPIEPLIGKRLEAIDFDHLLVADPVRDVLIWMNDPVGTRKSWGEGRWAAFVGRCRQDLGLHPQKDGNLTAAERLAAREGVWDQVWERYAEAHARYPQVLELLRRVGLPTDLFADSAGYPKANDDAEAELRKELVGLVQRSRAEAQKKLEVLEHEHAPRRTLLWAQMGLTPLAQALEHLSSLGALTGTSLSGTVAEMAARYQEQLWRIDSAAVSAIGSVQAKADMAAVEAALRALYVPWLEESVHRLQEQVRREGALGASPVVHEPGPVAYVAGLCIVFVDGLRYDIAHRLVELLQTKGHDIRLEAVWTTLPSVTASGKVWASPIAHRVQGKATDSDFEPSVKGEAKPLNTHHFRRVLVEEGWQYLTPSECGEVSGKAWTEVGDLDHYGHQHGLKLARDMEHLMFPIVERIQELVEAGWRQIRVVTDHGWLLVPGGLPKVDLPRFLADTRWGRCALLKENAKTDFLTLGWSWAPTVPIAMAPGMASFIAGAEYAHGGLSLQESLVPIIDIKIKAKVANKPLVEIASVQWTGLRCRIGLNKSLEGLWVDIRSKAAELTSSLVDKAKPVQDGKASLVVSNDEAEGQAAFVVIYDEAGELLAKRHTVIGE